ncbi:MAG TPA: ORF6N domain-containing protein [Verrucomicrobiae bacterium]|nr:ORF6N domain-containing protein [Verrucomicrobiae bacterium]
MSEKQTATMDGIESSILTFRGLRVMLDSDLAAVYGVPLKRLNEQVKRNRERFPSDFAFQLTAEEIKQIRSQIATGSLPIRSRVVSGLKYNPNYRPWVFTEHGALMLASVLNSPVAIDASIRVVRAFVLMREQLAAHKELSGKLSELENRVSGHDEAIQNLFEAIRQLIEPPVEKERKEIGFHIRETSTPYKVRSKKRF